MCFILMSIWATQTINRTYTHISAYQRHNWFIWIFSTILHSSTCQASRFFSLSVYYTNVLKSTFCCDNVLQSLPAYACRPTRSCECEDFLFCKFLLYKVFSFPCGSPLFSHIFQFRQSVRRQLHLLSSVFATIIANLFFPYNVQNF